MAIRMADAMQLEEYPPYDEPTVPATPETLNQEPATIATPVLTHGVAVNALQQYWHPKCQQIFSKGYKTTPRGKNNKTPQGGAGRTLFVAGKTPLCVGVIEGGSKDSEAASHGWRMSHFDAYFDRQAIKGEVLFGMSSFQAWILDYEHGVLELVWVHVLDIETTNLIDMSRDLQYILNQPLRDDDEPDDEKKKTLLSSISTWAGIQMIKLKTQVIDKKTALSTESQMMVWSMAVFLFPTGTKKGFNKSLLDCVKTGRVDLLFPDTIIVTMDVDGKQVVDTEPVWVIVSDRLHMCEGEALFKARDAFTRVLALEKKAEKQDKFNATILQRFELVETNQNIIFSELRKNKKMLIMLLFIGFVGAYIMASLIPVMLSFGATLAKAIRVFHKRNEELNRRLDETDAAAARDRETNKAKFNFFMRMTHLNDLNLKARLKEAKDNLIHQIIGNKTAIAETNEKIAETNEKIAETNEKMAIAETKTSNRFSNMSAKNIKKRDECAKLIKQLKEASANHTDSITTNQVQVEEVKRQLAEYIAVNNWSESLLADEVATLRNQPSPSTSTDMDDFLQSAEEILAGFSPPAAD